MFGKSSLALLLVGATHALSVITADDIVSGISTVDTAVVTFRKHIEAYTGGYLNQTDFFTDLATIVAATAVVDLEANLILSGFSETDSATIVDFYASTLGQDIPSTGQALLDKKSILEAQGEDELVALAQTTFQAATDDLASALEKWLTAELAKFEEAAKDIHDSLQKGIDAFSAV